MKRDPILFGLCYYALMFLLTIVFFKPLSGWLKSFKMSLHASRLNEPSLHSEIDLIHNDNEMNVNNQNHQQLNQQQNIQDQMQNKSQLFKISMQKELERLKIRSTILQKYDSHKKQPEIPKFIYRVSNSYYMKIGQFASEFLTDISNKLYFKKKQVNKNKYLNSDQKPNNDKLHNNKLKQGSLYKNKQQAQRRMKYLESLQNIDDNLSIPEEKPSFDQSFMESKILFLLYFNIETNDIDQTMNNLLSKQKNNDESINSIKRLIDKKSQKQLQIKVNHTQHYDNDNDQQEQSMNTLQNNRPWLTTQNDNLNNFYNNNNYNYNNDINYQTQSDINQTELSNRRQQKQQLNNNYNYMKELEEWQQQQERNFFNQKRKRSIFSENDQEKVQIPNDIQNLKDFKRFLIKQQKQFSQNIQQNNNNSDSIKDKMQQKHDKKQKNSQLQIQKQQQNYQLCDICCQDRADAVIMPCGHGGICFLCAFTLSKQTRNCHLCREKIYRIYQLKLNKNRNIVNAYTRIRACIDIKESLQQQQPLQNGNLQQNVIMQQPIYSYYRVQLKRLDDMSDDEKFYKQQYDQRYSSLSINDEFNFNESINSIESDEVNTGRMNVDINNNNANMTSPNEIKLEFINNNNINTNPFIIQNNNDLTTDIQQNNQDSHNNKNGEGSNKSTVQLKYSCNNFNEISFKNLNQNNNNLQQQLDQQQHKSSPQQNNNQSIQNLVDLLKQIDNNNDNINNNQNNYNGKEQTQILQQNDQEVSLQNDKQFIQKNNKQRKRKKQHHLKHIEQQQQQQNDSNFEIQDNNNNENHIVQINKTHFEKNMLNSNKGKAQIK